MKHLDNFELLIDAHPNAETLCTLHKISKINYYSGNLHIVRNFKLPFRLRDVQQPSIGHSQAARQEKLTLNDIDVFEYHEAFAVSTHTDLSHVSHTHTFT